MCARLIAGIFILACTTAVWAQGINIPVDDFDYDRSCPNPEPDYCDCMGSNSQAEMEAVWLPISNLGPQFNTFASGEMASVFSNCATNSGFKGASPPLTYWQRKSSYRMNYRDLTAIITAIDPTKNAVNGTDANPLILDASIHGHNSGQQLYTSAYVQLFAEDSLAPVTMTVEDPANPGEFIETRLTQTACGQNNSFSVPRQALAFGMHGGSSGLALKDNPDGSQCLPSYEIGTNVVYDGDKWMLLKSNYPTTGTQINAYHKLTRVVMTIRANSFDLTVYNDGVLLGERGGVSRQYLGAFTGLAIGSSAASDFNAYFDDISLTGGELVYQVSSEAGACCRPDHTCEMLPQLECEAIEGAVFKGADSVCGVGEGRCCADPIVDGDRDGDVDMEDFAMFQRCLTIANPAAEIPFECLCFDTNEDGAIDSVDFVNFAGNGVPPGEPGHIAGCVSGAGVDADIACDDNF